MERPWPKASPASKAARLVIDRNPFSTIHLGHIHRFFPDAKIIFVARDPRDVVLSNFMQNFRLNPATANFLDLRTACRYYAQVMDLYFHYRDVLPLNIHSVHDENLVADFEGEARRLLTFLGLEWDERVVDFHQTAHGKAIRTASYHQVIRPLYSTAAGRWKKYEEQLAPVLPILQPYVDVFERERTEAWNLAHPG